MSPKTNTTQNSSTGISEIEKIAFEYAWKWFELHAKQRIDVFRLFVILLGICAAGIGTAFRVEMYEAALVVSVLGAVICIVFSLLDARTRHLIEHGESCLQHHEDIFTKTLDNEKFSLTKRAHKKEGRVSYKISFMILLISAYLAFACTITYILIIKGIITLPFSN